MDDRRRAERLQIMLTKDEFNAIDDWRFNQRMPSRSAAVRELLSRGLAADHVDLAPAADQTSRLKPAHTRH